jgi:hypothetical protein
MPVRLITGPEQWAPELAAEVRQVILRHPGDRPLEFTIGAQQWVPEGWLVTPDVEFQTEIKELLGLNSIRL